MQAVNYGTSMKDIPYGGHSEYIMQLTHSTKKLTRHMRWAAKFKLDPPTGNYEEKNNFGFPSQEMPKLKQLFRFFLQQNDGTNLIFFFETLTFHPSVFC